MFAKVNGTKIFFDVTGLQYVPDGPVVREKPVCFVFHGGPGCSHVNYLNALPEMQKLSETMQLVFIDDRNCGLSEWGDVTTSSLKQNAADDDALREYLGLDKIYVMGHSYGGMSAMRYALDYPEHLQGLILVGTAANYRLNETTGEIVERRGTERQKQLWKAKQNGEVTDLGAYLLEMASLYNYRLVNGTEADFEAAREANARTKGWVNTEVNNYQRSPDGELSSFDMIPELPQVKCPVLVIAGKEDFITAPMHSERIHEAIPQSELHIVEEASHQLFTDRPDYVFPCIREFVERTYKK